MERIINLLCGILFFSFIFITKSSFIHAQNENLNTPNDFDIFDRWIEWSDGKNMLVHHLNKQAFVYLDLRAQEIAKLRSEADWKNKQKKIEETHMKIFGPFPEKMPLNPMITGIIYKEGYRIEKIIYESMPDFYVTACMFIPDGITGKTPTIIYVSGHSPIGFRHLSYQKVILNYVKKGFIVFAFDPIDQGERRQYPEDKFSIVGSKYSHHYYGFQCFISGVSPGRYFTWDGIRAVDYLLTRSETDPSRIGMTGVSGGGTQTGYIAAIDERIKAAAPGNWMTNSKRLLQSVGPQDAEQNLFQGFLMGMDHADYLLVRAPKPALMMTTTRDNFSIQGARETASEVARIYMAYGKADNFGMVEDVSGHDFTLKNRISTYAFFQKHLGLPGNPDEVDVELFEPEELNVTPTGQVLTYLGGETVFSINKKETQKLIEEIEDSRKNIKEHLIHVKQKAKELSGYASPCDEVEPVFCGSYLRDGYSIEMYGLQGEGDYVVPLLVFIPEGGGEFPSVIYIHPKGKSADASPGGQIEEIVKLGFIVAAPDLLGTGETADTKWNTYAVALQIGRSIVGIQAGDIVRVVNYLKNRNDVQYNKIGAIAFDGMCPALLHAAAFDQSISRIALVGSPISYKSIVMNRYFKYNDLHSSVAGALTAYDLPDLAGCIAPRKLIMSELKDQMKEPASKSLIEEELAFPRSVYSFEDVSENMKVLEFEPDRGINSYIDLWNK